jgi:tetratricopeptide (TPR) repeat protein
MPDFDHLWDYDHPAETEQKFRRILGIAETSGDLSYTIQLLSQIARAQGLQREFAAAHKTLDKAQALLTADLTIAHIRYLLERGRVFNSARQVEEARPLFLEAWPLALAANADFYAVDAAHMLGIIEPPDQQLIWNLRAVELAEKSAEPRARNWLGSLYNNIGWTYHDMAQYEAALLTFQKALQWREAQQQAESIRIARWCVARTLRSLQRVEEALIIQRALLAEYQSCGQPSGYVYEEMAECLFLLNQKEEARLYFGLAHERLSQDTWLAANEPDRLQRLQELWQSG